MQTLPVPHLRETAIDVPPEHVGRRGGRQRQHASRPLPNGNVPRNVRVRRSEADRSYGLALGAAVAEGAGAAEPDGDGESDGDGDGVGGGFLSGGHSAPALGVSWTSIW